MTDDLESIDFDIQDPIVEAFPVMMEAANHHCRPTGEGGGVCFAYHRLIGSIPGGRTAKRPVAAADRIPRGEPPRTGDTAGERASQERLAAMGDRAGS